MWTDDVNFPILQDQISLGNDTAVITVENLTRNTLYHCNVTAESNYPTVTKDTTVTTLAEIGDIDLAIELTVAPFPVSHATVR